MPMNADLAVADAVMVETTDDHSSFTRLLSESRAEIFRYIFSLVPQANDAEDLFQRTSVVLWKKFADYDHDRSFTSWACGVARYEVQNFRRLAKANRLVFSSAVLHALAAQLDEADPCHFGERMTTLRGCLERLPRRDRMLLQRVFWDSQGYEEVSREQGLALQTIYNRMHLVRRRLLDCIARKTAVKD